MAADAVSATTIQVAGTPGYDVTIGRGLLDTLPSQLGAAVARVLIVHAPILGARAEALREQWWAAWERLAEQAEAL